MGKTFEIDVSELQGPKTFEIETAQPEMGFGRSVLDQALGTGELAMSVGSGALGSIVGGLVGATNLPFRGKEYAAQQTESYRNALTYEPRTRSGRAAVDLASAPSTWLSGLAQKGSDATFEATGSPGLATGVNVALESLPAIAAKGLKAPIANRVQARSAKIGAERSQHSVELETMERAKQEGFAVDPMWSDTKKLSQNQEAANRVARREAGLGESEPLTRENLAASRKEMSQPYREVSALSPVAKSGVKELEQARYEASRNYEYYRTTRNPETQDKARRYEQESEIWEAMVENEAKRHGRSDLIPKLRKAREDLAKNHDVEVAVNHGSGNMDISVLGRMLDHGRPLTGGLETMARFDQATRGALASGGVGVEQGGLGYVPLSKIGMVSKAVDKLSRMRGRKSYNEPLSLSDIASRRPEVYMLSPTLAQDQQ